MIILFAFSSHRTPVVSFSGQKMAIPMKRVYFAEASRRLSFINALACLCPPRRKEHRLELGGTQVEMCLKMRAQDLRALI